MGIISQRTEDVINLFDDESKWTKDTLIRDCYGACLPTHYLDLFSDCKSDKVVCWCLSGAFFKVASSSEEAYKCLHAVSGYLKSTGNGSYPYIPDFNDDPNVTFSDMQKFLTEFYDYTKNKNL